MLKSKPATSSDLGRAIISVDHKSTQIRALLKPSVEREHFVQKTELPAFYREDLVAYERVA
jgi:hypothetical protein